MKETSMQILTERRQSEKATVYSNSVFQCIPEVKTMETLKRSEVGEGKNEEMEYRNFKAVKTSYVIL